MTHTPHRLAVIGECMLELCRAEGNLYRMSFSGDTLNVAIYFARCTDPYHFVVYYVSAVGDDPYSRAMLEVLVQEGIQIQWIRSVAGQLSGLYFIHTDAQGERKFYYYRSQSAAKKMFYGPEGDELCDRLLTCHTWYLSGITLAILEEAGRAKLLDLLQEGKKRNIVICFDFNYRAGLWLDVITARRVMQQVLDHVHVALPSLEDAEAVFGDITPEAVALRLRHQGVAEIIVKQGKRGYFLSYEQEERQVSVPSIYPVVDTTAAGDSFNGAYLAARLQGIDPGCAAQKAAALAAIVIQHQGAIIPRERMPK